jgi:RNA polymerase sigma-70 factor (ECF subfamily)
MAEDDRELLERYCRDGDRLAFTRFYRSRADRLWRFLRARGTDPETAYDLVAEAFLRFLESVCRDPRHPAALLYRIAINLGTDHHRRRRISPEQPDPDGIAAMAADPAAAPDDERAFVRALVARLPEREQNLLLLRYWIGLTHREIAEMLDQPEGTVRRQCSEALAAVRAAWRGAEGG